MGERIEGVVCAVVGTRGFGFISTGAERTFKKYWWHITSFQNGVLPFEGMRVTFEVDTFQRGVCPTATAIEVVQ
jgi:cold shock CspA family protein